MQLFEKTLVNRKPAISKGKDEANEMKQINLTLNLNWLFRYDILCLYYMAL